MNVSLASIGRQVAIAIWKFVVAPAAVVVLSFLGLLFLVALLNGCAAAPRIPGCEVVKARGEVTYAMLIRKGDEWYVHEPSKETKGKALVLEKGSNVVLAGFWDENGKPIESYIRPLYERRADEKFCLQ